MLVCITPSCNQEDDNDFFIVSNLIDDPIVAEAIAPRPAHWSAQRLDVGMPARICGDLLDISPQSLLKWAIGLIYESLRPFRQPNAIHTSLPLDIVERYVFPSLRLELSRA